MTVISEQGGKEKTQHDDVERFCSSRGTGDGNYRSIVGDLDGTRTAPRPNPEVVARAKRRRYTAEFKQRILAEADAAKGSGEIGAVLRRNRLYSSHLVKWRRERAARHRGRADSAKAGSEIEGQSLD